MPNNCGFIQQYPIILTRLAIWYHTIIIAKRVSITGQSIHVQAIARRVILCSQRIMHTCRLTMSV